MEPLAQRTRLLILTLYILALFGASRLALGTWMPPTTEKGLWFYAGLAVLLLGNLLVTPFFTKPADAISYAVASLVALLAVNVWIQADRAPFDRFLWSVATIYVLIVLVAGTLSIAFKDSLVVPRQRISKFLYLLSSTLGTPRSIFSVVFLFALLAFHRNNPREYLVISVAWAVVVGLSPLETLADLSRHLWRLWGSSPGVEPLGEVVGHQLPAVVLIQHESGTRATFGDPLVVPADDGRPGLALALDYVGVSEGLWLRAITLGISQESRSRLTEVVTLGASTKALAWRADFTTLRIPSPTDLAWDSRGRLVGLVATDTDIARVRFEIVRTDLDLQEGRLVEVEIGDSRVLYQIVNGLTREEIVQQKNTRGYVRADAKKIGRWDENRRRFEVVKWLPPLNNPVFLVEESRPASDKSAVGYFPGTSYSVSVDDIHSLVTYNTAILGILGAGKSFLALELVERMIASGIKVICLDLTNQYAQELRPYYDVEAEQRALKQLQAVGRAGKDNVQWNVEEGGSVLQFQAAMREDLRLFLDPADARRVKIYNPVAFEVWRQDSRQFQGQASMASLTPTEVTRIVTEATLEILQDRMSEEARCCLVFEEAHSLIPEWNAVASEGDKAATNGTAKAILQGRKYGLGCMVVTQRTANVTKSILNQCNTIFALRVFDATGMEFLRNYIGEDYVGILSRLEDRHAVIFGRASSCRDPVLIRLNDRADFVRLFRGGDAEEAPAEIAS